MCLIDIIYTMRGFDNINCFVDNEYNDAIEINGMVITFIILYTAFMIVLYFN